jgi:hypothetical protein
MGMNDMSLKMDQVDIFIKDTQTQPVRKMAAILKSIELTYFAEKSLKDEKLLKSITQDGNDSTLDPELKIFLRPFYNLQFE